MGIFTEDRWECKSCGYEFYANDGMYEADPNDFGTTHIVSSYYCPKCGNFENVAICVGIDRPQPGNEDLCVHDDTKCENCNTEMKSLKKKNFIFLPKKYKCPVCGKKTVVFTGETDEIMT